MAIALSALEQFLNTLLEVDQFQDYCPNGLQVESCEVIGKVVFGVTASQALIDKAVEEKADAIVVHHGYFWKGEADAITGIKASRIKSLMNNGISLFAYHLPLDAHAALGNNAQLAELLGFTVEGGLDDSPRPIGNVGALVKPQSLLELASHIEEVLGRKPLMIGDEQRVINTVAWCSGAAQSYIGKAAERGADCFISGEISESTVHEARERGIAYISAGHHATERYGVKALSQYVSKELGVECLFIDIDNPV